MPNAFQSIVTVTLNPAFDRLIDVPGFIAGAHQLGTLVARSPAGKGVNVARSLDRLGVPSIATGFVGRESLDEYDQSFAKTSVNPQFLAIDGAVRENITLLDSAGGAETHVRCGGLTPTEADLDRLKHKINLLAKPDGLVVFSGSPPPQISVGVVCDLIDLAISNGSSVAVDGPGELLAALSGRKLWLAKPNRAELAALAPVDADQESSAPPDTSDQAESANRVLTDDHVIAIGCSLSKDIRTLIVSSGSAGGYLFVDQAVFLAQVELGDEPVISSVGCGDAMLAGYVAAQDRGMDIKEAYRYALAVATAAALSPLPGTFDTQTVDHLVARVSVEAGQ